MSLLPRVLLVLLVSVHAAIAAAPAASDIDTVAARLARPELLRGRFEQRKQVTGFRNPMRSRGHFVLARGRGVVWQTEQPFASTLVVTPERITVTAGASTRRIDAAQEPALRAINRLLFDLLAGDIARLQADFELQSVALDGERWHLRLRPKAGAFATVFDAVELEGARQVERVLLVERNGDRTDIGFSDHAEQPALDDDEAARLAD